VNTLGLVNHLTLSLRGGQVDGKELTTADEMACSKIGILDCVIRDCQANYVDEVFGSKNLAQIQLFEKSEGKHRRTGLTSAVRLILAHSKAEMPTGSGLWILKRIIAA
jgi:hypothetical protein